jgi:hypothetical protein
MITTVATKAASPVIRVVPCFRVST